jgi:hypothetical protein
MQCVAAKNLPGILERICAEVVDGPWILPVNFLNEPELIMVRAGWSSINNQPGLAKLYWTIKHTMDKTLQAMVDAAGTIFFEAVTMIIAIATMV